MRKEEKVPFTKQKIYSIILSEAIEAPGKRVLEEVSVEAIASSDSGYGVGRYLQ